MSARIICRYRSIAPTRSGVSPVDACLIKVRYLYHSPLLHSRLWPRCGIARVSGLLLRRCLLGLPRARRWCIDTSRHGWMVLVLRVLRMAAHQSGIMADTLVLHGSGVSLIPERPFTHDPFVHGPFIPHSFPYGT